MWISGKVALNLDFTGFLVLIIMWIECGKYVDRMCITYTRYVDKNVDKKTAAPKKAPQTYIFYIAISKNASP